MKEVCNVYKVCDVKGQSGKHNVNGFSKRGIKNIKDYNQVIYDNFNDVNRSTVSRKTDKIRILVVGALATHKWLQYEIIQKYIIPKLTDDDYNSYELRLIGSKKHKKFKDLYSNNIVVHKEYVDDIYEEFMECDIFLSPTPMNIGLRSSIIEAMSFKNCILTSNFDANQLPVLKNNINCCINTNKNKLYDDLIFLGKKPELRKKLGNQARIDYLKNFAPEISCSTYEKDMINMISS